MVLGEGARGASRHTRLWSEGKELLKVLSTEEAIAAVFSLSHIPQAADAAVARTRQA